jgi:serine/threonine protein kinase
MSPEQLADPRSVDFRSDIYSLGVTLREAATGEPPPESRKRSDRAASEMPAGLAPIVTWMVAHDPDDRPSSYRELRDALVPVCDREPATPGDLITVPPDRKSELR